MDITSLKNMAKHKETNFMSFKAENPRHLEKLNGSSDYTKFSSSSSDSLATFLSLTNIVDTAIKRKQIQAKIRIAFLNPIAPYNCCNIIVKHEEPTKPPIVATEHAMARFQKPVTQNPNQRRHCKRGPYSCDNGK